MLWHGGDDSELCARLLVLSKSWLQHPSTMAGISASISVEHEIRCQCLEDDELILHVR